jgi:bifunctional non-homologous end joining protein LigD
VSLERYRDKRDFARTPEPAGAAPPPPPDGAPRFVVQRHRARRLHYDFRLEIDGVLVSWAVPKGLTLDPTVRHLAVHVEDHPLEYFDFEGVIPRGEYGAGDVIVWDQGTWELHRDPDAAAAVAAGELHLELHGTKLRGTFVLVRTDRSRGRGRGGSAEQWIVLHKRDDAAVDGWDPEDHPRSVVSGLTNEQVAADPDRLWTRAGEQVLRSPLPEVPAPTPDELDALDALAGEGTWTLQGHDVALTNLDKVLFPARDESGPVTKRDLVRYYASIAPVMVPYLAGRPLNLQRFPDGVERKGFWQKAAPRYAPAWIPRWRNPDATEGTSEQYLVADSGPALAWLAQHAAVELHAWTSRTDAVAHPTYALVDIDPGTDTAWSDLLLLARLHRDALAHLGVRGYPKLTGQRGIQVWIPIRSGPTFADTRGWVEQLSRAIGAVAPQLVSWQWEKDRRGGRARLDYTQNVIGKTLVAPYSARPAPGAPVSTPIEWDELDDPDLTADRYTVRTVVERVARIGDPMAPALHDPQTLPPLV